MIHTIQYLSYSSNQYLSDWTITWLFHDQSSHCQSQ